MSTLMNYLARFHSRDPSWRVANLRAWFSELPSDAAASMNRLPRAVLVLILTLAFYCGYAGQTVRAETAGAPVADRSLYIEPPEDHSGKSLATDILGSLHDELESELGKAQKVSAKPDAQVLVHVEVIDFNMRSGFNRWALGAMSGKDSITSKVSLVEARNGATLLSIQVTTSTANQWRGENSIARLHAQEIAKALAQKSEAK